MQGFSLGTGLGLASATLWARSKSHASWKGFVTIGASGALAGTLSGVGVAFAEAGGGPPYPGLFVLESMNGGLALGALTGTVAGSLVWLNDGRPMSMLDGAAVGALAGSVVGLAFALVKGVPSVGAPDAPRRSERDRKVHVTVTSLSSEDGSVPALMAFGTF
jgi:hypothetical protein